MKKKMISLALRALLLTGCARKETSSPSLSEPTTNSEASKDSDNSSASSSSDGDIEAGATETGQGGLNFGDVDWSDDLKKEALDTYLSGIGDNHRERRQIATLSNGKPQIASVEYYRDTNNHWFFGSSESVTGKVLDRKKDPDVALYWTRQLRAADRSRAPNYFTSYGVEIIGTANFYTTEQVNALPTSEKASVIAIARGYYKSRGAQYKKFYDETAEGYRDDATFVTYVFGSTTNTPYIIKPTKIILTSPYLLFIERVDGEEGEYHYAFKQDQRTLGEYTFLPKAFLDKLLNFVRNAKSDQALNKFTTMVDRTSATGLKTQVTLSF